MHLSEIQNLKSPNYLFSSGSGLTAPLELTK